MGCDSLDRFIRIKDNHMLAGEVNLEAHDRRFLVVDEEFEETPRCFRCCDVSTVSELRNFVTLLYFNGGAVGAFMCILGDVFRCCKRHDAFYIDVRIISYIRIREGREMKVSDLPR